MARGAVKVSITGDTSGLTRATRQAEGSLARLSREGKKHLGALAKAASGLAAAYVGIEAAKGAVETTESLAKSTILLKRNFGLSAEAASTWSSVLKVNNVDMRSAQMSFTTLSKAVANGSKSSTQAFKDLGISQKELKSQNFDQTLNQVVDALTHMEGGAKRAADAQILLGRGAKTLAPLFRNDGLGFQQQAKWAKEYGVTLDGHALKSSKELTVATTQLKFAQMGMQILFTEKVIPTVTHVAEAAAKFIGQMRDGTGAGGRFAAQMEQLWQQLQPVRDTIKAIGKFLAEHPKLLAAAAGAFVIWRAAAAAASAIAKAKLIATFLGLGPKAAVGGAEAGTAFGEAAATTASRRMRAFKWPTLGLSIGRLLGLAIGEAAAVQISGAIGKALHYNPQAATGGGGGGIKIGFGGVPVLKDIPGALNKLNPFGATGGLVAGRYSEGDKHTIHVAGEEVILTPKQQQMIGPDRIFAALKATGGRIINGRGGGARTGGVIGPQTVAKMQAYGNSMAARNLPYVFGGGHAGFGPTGGGFDCSGFVSAILGVGGAISSPMAVREPLQSALVPGPGRFVTVGIRGSSGRNAHTMIKVGNQYFESGGGGNGAHRRSGWNGSFDFFHPRNEATSSGPGGVAAPGGTTSAGANGRKSHLQVSQTGTSGHIPGSDLGIVNGNALPVPSFSSSVSGSAGGAFASAGDTGSPDQAQIDALNALNARLQAMNDLLAQQVANQKQLFNVSQSQYGVLAQAIAGVVSGQIGGRLGLGFQTPGFAGGGVRY